ncbi:hypothetical protein GCM10023195_61410 [Actinoallomurus liliacearum]|uniref:Uncharacterized protein n=1 Tax=Actinoallomurus liliacearum TaxID=1080073 RepID=A0ABP8TQJ0_9ACTN
MQGARGQLRNGQVDGSHPRDLDGEPTAERFAATEHLTVSRLGGFEGAIDAARRAGVAPPGGGLGAQVVLGPGHADGDRSRRPGCPAAAHASTIERFGLVAFDLPVEVPSPPVDMVWHRRHRTRRTRGCAASSARGSPTPSTGPDPDRSARVPWG